MSEEHENEVPEDEEAFEEQEEPAAAPEEEAVESLMGLRDFLAVAPRHRSDAVTKAAHKAMERWIRLHGNDVNGYYTMEEWQEHYKRAMAYTG